MPDGTAVKRPPDNSGPQGPGAPLAGSRATEDHLGIGGLDIPYQVAPQQSLVPLLQVWPVYPESIVEGNHFWTPELCLENPNQYRYERLT